MKRPLQLQVILLAGIGLLSGCGATGRVQQGRVVEYDRSTGVLTVIEDSNFRDPANPRFDVLPPVTVAVPDDPLEMGPQPETGRLLRLDCARGEAAIFDPATSTIRTAGFNLVSEKTGVAPSDPLVRGSRFPLVDPASRNITVYSPRDHVLATIAPRDTGLPAESWKFGDEVRYYYKQPGRALRLMNISQTDFSKVGK